MMENYMAIPALVCLLFSSLYGCTGPLAMHGLSGGVPVAFNSTGKGQGDSARLAHYDDVVQATLTAGQRLSFKLEKKSIGRDQSALNYIDDRGSKLEILIEGRTETVTRARFNVGWFGSTSIGRLMAR